MSMLAKILIVLNLILAVVVMGAAGAYLQSAENWKGEHAKLKVKYDQETKELNESLKKTQGSLDEALRGKATALQAQAAAEATRNTLSENNTLLQKKLGDLVGSFQNMESRVKDLQGNLDAARQENSKLQSDKKTAEDERRAALDAQAKAELEQKRLTAENGNLSDMLDASKKDGVAKADALEAANVHLKMYMDKYPNPGVAAAPIKGQVLAADPSLDIYLISVGEKDNVKVSDELTVSRGDQFIAVVVVDKVFADKASVTVKRVDGKPMKKSDIKQGDKVGNAY